MRLYMHIYIYIYIYTFSRLFSIIGYYKTLSVIHCTLQKALVVYYFMYVACIFWPQTPNFSLLLCHFPPPMLTIICFLCFWVYFGFVNKLIGIFFRWPGTFSEQLCSSFSISLFENALLCQDLTFAKAQGWDSHNKTVPLKLGLQSPVKSKEKFFPSSPVSQPSGF